MPAVDRVIGIGSPHGDDVAGWRVVEMLTSREELTTECDAIGAGQLLDYLQGCQHVILIDACQSAQPPGTITRLEWPDARIPVQHWRSTHALSVGETLELAAELGRLPGRVVLFGIEISNCQPGAELNPVVASALPELERRVLGEVSAD
jgi:hydrogenase maturation protease